MHLGNKIKQIIKEQGLDFVEKERTVYTKCPTCGRSDKFSIIKENGACVCYRASCNFGRQWFPDWLVLTAGVSYKEARDKIYGARLETGVQEGDKLNLSLKEDPTEAEEEAAPPEIAPVEWPLKDAFPIDGPEGRDGALYLESRGIPVPLAKWYGIMYSALRRRVILPIFYAGQCYGWQGRAIDKVDKGLRMRNNVGFRRDSMLMFEDRLVGSPHAVVLEGPVNALKFHLVGGNVATMGKVVTDIQLKKILSHKPKAIYLGLDPDAAKEAREIADRVNVMSPCLPVYHMMFWGPAVERAVAQGVKPDFGECTFEECKWSFEHAVRIGGQEFLPFYLEDENEIIKKLNRKD